MRMPLIFTRIAETLLPRAIHPDLSASWKALSSLDQTLDLEAYDFVVVDTELTGMDPRTDEIVSIGAVRIRNMRINPSDSFYTLVRPEMDLPRLSTLIHHITPDEVENAPPLSEALPDFLRFAGTSLLIGHHVGLDIGFLNRASRRIFGGPFRNPCLDTLRLAQAYQEELFGSYYDQFNLQISYNLADLATQHNLPEFPTHNALLDAMQSAYLFLFLVRKLQSGTIRTLKDLHTAGRTRRFL
ncbi:MAG: 3'-5' exonuclease [Proteobacteria bacterium]|nr:3'-5' exonuclease [Pseudomonadota bacterium]MBU1611095.1 3'-5' exonuclease [Pseudomonadota bacterium]